MTGGWPPGDGPTRRGADGPRVGTVDGVTWRRLLVGLVVMVALVAAVLAVRAVGVSGVRAAVEAGGIWAPLLFVLLSGAVTVTPVPRTVFTVAAGVLFGSVTGVLLAVSGTTFAAVVAYWLVRTVGARFVARHEHRPALAWVRARLDRRGLLAVLSLRLIPAVPFSILNYAAGFSGVRFAPYVVGTVLGVLPGTVTVVVLGDAVTGGNPHPVLLAVSLGCGLLGLAGVLLVARRPAVLAVAAE